MHEYIYKTISAVMSIDFTTRNPTINTFRAIHETFQPCDVNINEPGSGHISVKNVRKITKIVYDCKRMYVIFKSFRGSEAFKMVLILP